MKISSVFAMLVLVAMVVGSMPVARAQAGDVCLVSVHVTYNPRLKFLPQEVDMSFDTTSSACAIQGLDVINPLSVSGITTGTMSCLAGVAIAGTSTVGYSDHDPANGGAASVGSPTAMVIAVFPSESIVAGTMVLSSAELPDTDACGGDGLASVDVLGAFVFAEI